MFQPELQQMCLNKPLVLNNLKYGIFSKYESKMPPPPAPFTSVHVVSQADVSVFQPVGWMA